MSLQAPAHSDELIVAFPAEHVLQLTLNRPRSLNAMTPTMSDDLKALLDWFEDEPQLWVVIVTGAGRVFCAGADLKAWNTDQQNGTTNEQERTAANVHGFGSISRRQSSKPIIAAVNGGAYGGGLELVVNCDLVVAAQDAKFAFPEVKRGVVAIQGGIPRIARIAGHQLASELLLTGKTISAAEAQNRFGFVNTVVPTADVLPTAFKLARQIIENSPDAVQCTKKGLLLSHQHNFSETLFATVWSSESKRVYKGDNIKEGLKAFSEKRLPSWKNPAKL
ncbi:enoyl-CoA hydratase [Crucibulum laeve]|uniref:Enoyl-CoA hydratase n=1 Tax=Crucibulum laeve TaxID=68775 RepID=A0A5C3MC27_9AGAR|nr:enoyl-CoA hydratase [Crucibulum laeve]